METAFAKQIRAMPAPLRGKKSTVALSDAYYMTEELRATLGDGLPYVDAFLVSQMLDDCRVTHRLNAKSLVKRLNELKQNDAGTTKQVQAIYRVLDERLWEFDSTFIRQSVEEDALIQLKGAHKGWFSPSGVAWQTNGLFLDSLYPPVQSLYRDFQGFLIEKLRIPKALPIKQRVEALMRLGEVADRAMRELEALAIYKRAEQALRPQFGREIEMPDWMHTFKNEAVFVDHWGAVVDNAGFLFANDSPALAELFENEEGLSLLAIPSIEVPRLSRLLGAAGVARLSESVSIEVEGDGFGMVDADLTARVQRAVPYVARVLYSRNPEAFEDALDGGKLSTLWTLTVVEVRTVNLRVTLGEFRRTTTTDAAMANGQVLYRTDAKSLKDRVAAELSKYLVGTLDFADSFARILLAEDADGIEEFLGVVSIGRLPSDLADALRQRELLAEDEPLPTSQDAAEHDAAQQFEEATPNEGEGPADDVVREGPEAVGPADEAADGHSAEITSEPPQSGVSSQALELTGPATPSGQLAPLPAAPSRPSATPLASAPISSTGGQISGQNRGDAPGEPSVHLRTIAPSHSNDAVGLRPPAPSPVAGNPSGREPSPLAPLIGGSPNAKGLGPRLQDDGALSGRTAKPSSLRARSGRLLSYVVGPAELGQNTRADNSGQAATRDATGRAAVEHFLKTQAKRWASLTEMPHNNPGFDVLAQTASGEEEYIEVKGQTGAWTQEGVALTPTELLTAQRKGGRYWLCVVEFAQDVKRRQMHLLRDPFGLVTQFRFDVGWKAAAETVTTVPAVPEKGLYIDIAGVGMGTILSVRGKGLFFHVHVILKDGKQVNSLFHPAKMSLSKEPPWHE
ncbi:protein NO VEIN domain-containing protein [Rhizobacter fulvus]